jgi:hypothetical protein
MFPFVTLSAEGAHETTKPKDREDASCNHATSGSSPERMISQKP